jgi:Polyglycine hydrolase-like, structural repeat/Peptidase family M23
MATPNLTINVEPAEGGSVVYLPLAPKKSNADDNAQLSLKLKIKNNETKAVKITKLKISFVGQPSVASKTITLDIDIAKNADATWFFQPADNMLIPNPAPPQIKLELTANTFSSPASVTMPLKAHLSPVAGGSYDFPAKPSDLRVGEYWSGMSATHGAAGDGGQLFAYDLGVVWFDQAANQWTGLLPGKDGSKNEHFRIWGKPVYAMANGTVVEFRNDIPTNPSPPADLSPPHPVEGNHFYIQHGAELCLYAHFQPGSLNSNLLQVGAFVSKGQFLGLAGNSGNSTAPHLHLHSLKGIAPWSGPLRPLPFRNTHMIEFASLNPPSPDGLWTKAEDQGVPSVWSAIYPSASKPQWYPPGWGEIARHGIPEGEYQTEFDKIMNSGYRPVWVDGYDVGGKTFFNVIFRPNDGTAWVARHGLDGAGYQTEFDKWTQQGFRLLHIEIYLSGGKVRYAPIFVKTVGGVPFIAYHGLNADQHQQQFDSLSAQGFRPVNITAVSPNGNRVYVGLYEKRDVGSFFVKSFNTPQEYQTQFDQNIAAGRKLVYLGAYTHNGAPRISAIWHQKAAPNFVARHGLSSSQYQAEFDLRLSQGFLTRAVTGYAEGNSHRFAAYWSK